jgi:hypothetical protein
VAFDAGAIEATLDLDRSPFTRGMKAARREGEQFEKKKFTATADIDTSKVNRALARVGSKRAGAIRIPVDVDEPQLQKSLNTIGANTQRTANRVGNRLARALLSPLGLQMAVFPGLIASGVAAAGVSLAALPLLFGAAAGAILAKNEAVASSFLDLWNTVREDAQKIIEPMIPWALKVSDELSKSWARMGPDFADISSDLGPQVLDLTQGITGMFENMIGGMADAIQLGGPAVRGFESLLRRTGIGVGDFFSNIAAESYDTGTGLQVLGTILQDTLGFAGSFIAQMASQWATSGPQIQETISQLLDIFLQFTDTALPMFGSGLETILSALQILMFFLQPFAGFLGGATGQIIAMVAGAKLLSVAFTGVGRAWNNLRPATWQGRLQNAADAMTNFGERAGQSVGGIYGSQRATDKFTRAGERLGRGLQSLGGAIPFVGLAIVGIGLIQEQAAEKADKMAQALLRGGQAAADASQQIARMEESQRKFASSLPIVGEGIAEKLFGSAAEAKKIYQEQKEGMTEVERAQLRAAQAQREYEEAMRNQGPASQAAQVAAINLSNATDNVEAAQRDAADATKSHTDKIIEQTNMMLGAIGARLNYDSSLLQLEQSQKSVNDAVKAHGKNSIEAKEANIQYQQGLLSVIQSLGARVAAENASRGETKANEIATYAMRMEIARLAVAAGTNLPPALATMAAGLTDGELAAMGVKRGVDKAGNAIYRMPPGKRLAFPNDAAAAKAKVDALKGAIDAVRPTKWVDFYINTIVLGDPIPSGSGVPGMLGEAGKAQGGLVRKGVATWVGEGGRELFIPAADGEIIPHTKSERVSNEGLHRAPVQTAVAGDGSNKTDDLLAYIAQLLENQKLSVAMDELAFGVNKTNLRNGVR